MESLLNVIVINIHCLLELLQNGTILSSLNCLRYPNKTNFKIEQNIVTAIQQL
jgi:hypothetical protein